MLYRKITRTISYFNSRTPPIKGSERHIHVCMCMSSLKCGIFQGINHCPLQEFCQFPATSLRVYFTLWNSSRVQIDSKFV